MFIKSLCKYEFMEKELKFNFRTSQIGNSHLNYNKYEIGVKSIGFYAHI